MRYATPFANSGVPFAAIAFICHDRERKNMTRRDKLLDRILRGTADANIPFAELCQLLRRLGFEERVRGSHHILTKEGVEEILNL